MAASNESAIDIPFKPYSFKNENYVAFSDGVKKDFDGYSFLISGGDSEINVGNHYLKQKITGSNKKPASFSVDTEKEIYSNVIDDVSLKFQMTSNKVKEYVLLNKKKELSWTIDTDLKIVKKNNGILEFYNGFDCLDPFCKNYGHSPIIKSDKFFVIDSNNKSYYVDFKLIGNEVIINDYPDDIKFPIVIDPSFIVNTGQDACSYPSGRNGIQIDSKGNMYSVCESTIDVDNYGINIFYSSNGGNNWNKIVNDYYSSTSNSHYNFNYKIDHNDNLIIYYSYRQNGISNLGRAAEFAKFNSSGFISSSSIAIYPSSDGLYNQTLNIDKDNNYYFSFSTSGPSYTLHNLNVMKYNGLTYSNIDFSTSSIGNLTSQLDNNDDISFIFNYCHGNYSDSCQIKLYDNDTTSSPVLIFDGLGLDPSLNSEPDYCTSAITQDGVLHYVCAYYVDSGNYDFHYIYLYNDGSWSSTNTIAITNGYASMAGNFVSNLKNELYFIYQDYHDYGNNQIDINKVDVLDQDYSSWSSTSTVIEYNTNGLIGSSPFPYQSNNPNEPSLTPSNGYMFNYTTDDYTYYGIDSFFSNDFSLIPGNKYDLSTSTNSTRFAWYGIGNATSVPPTFNRTDTASWTYKTGTIFSTAMYDNASTSNNAWATTAFNQLTGHASTSWWYFGTLIHAFEMLIDEPTSTVNTSTWRWEGYCSLASTTDATITAAHDVRMFLYDYDNATFTNVTSSLDGTCTSTNCVLEYTTTTPTNISKFFTASSSKALTRWLVTCPDIGSDCHYAGNVELTCGKIATGTVFGTTTAIGCQPQDPSEDLYDQCATGTSIALGCKTGYCGGIALFGSFPWGCGWYYDGAQHNCPTCYGCPSSFDPSKDKCEAKTTSYGSGAYGCTGACKYCNGGTCGNVPNFNAGACTGGQLCCNGACATLSACQIICGTCGTASCRANGQQAACLSSGGTPDGNGAGCLPTNFCCCGA